MRGRGRLGVIQQPLGWGMGRRPLMWGRPMWRRGFWARWLWMGPFMLLLFDTGRYKLHQSDVGRVETATGRAATDLSEEELVAAMRRLGIQKLVLSEEDEAAIAGA
jgi:beta-lactamase superfamily II metal-dependent hydrolase